MADELIDVVDPATGAVIDTALRSAVHAAGRWHQVFHCLVMRPSAGTIVLQERSPHKAAFGGKLDLSATGHLAAGEQPLEGIRELHEELGADIAADSLVSIGTRLLADDQGEAHNRELVHLYFCADDRPLDAYRPAPDEVSRLVEIPASDLVALVGDPTLTVDTTAWDAEGGYQPHPIRRSALVADAGQYWTVLAVMAERFLRGERPLAI
ncbi:MAG: NUDIX domain-containing protein [Actinomycetota bacterium]